MITIIVHNSYEDSIVSVVVQNRYESCANLRNLTAQICEITRNSASICKTSQQYQSAELHSNIHSVA